MGLSFEEVNILGNIVNDTYGKGSTSNGSYGNGKLGGYNLGGAGTSSSCTNKASLQGNHLYVTSLIVVNLGPINYQHKSISDAENELNARVKAHHNTIKKEFKKESGRALKSKLVKNSETTDIDMLNHHASTRSAIVRRTFCFEIG
jgi:hypothetical protein